MKIGIFSDIHGNIYAFNAIWELLKKESCDLYFLLGDICGYYYYQNEIIDIIREAKNIIAICGNHDDIFLKALSDVNLAKKYTEEYGKSVEILKKNIKEINRKFLNELPKKYILEDYQTALFHGSPWDYLDGYVYPTDSISRFQELPYKCVMLGHTHYPMNRTLPNIRIINPGSCGQPRDFNAPSCAIFNPKTGNVTIKRVTYETESMVKDVLKHQEAHKYLVDILRKEKN